MPQEGFGSLSMQPVAYTLSCSTHAVVVVIKVDSIGDVKWFGDSGWYECEQCDNGG